MNYKLIGGVLAVIVVIPAAGLLLPRCNGGYELALEALNECHFAVQTLGPDITQTPLGITCYADDTTAEGSDGVEWQFPVAGDNGSGTFQYRAEFTNGQWKLVRAFLNTGNTQVLAFPSCFTPTEIPASAKVALRHSYKLKAKVLQVTGKAGVTVAAACRISIDPHAAFGKNSPFNCQVQIHCGPTIMYGAGPTGFTSCGVKNGELILANDPWPTSQDNDPMMEIDLNSNQVILIDDQQGHQYRVVLSLTGAEATPKTSPQ